jgi:hypothetical protein
MRQPSDRLASYIQEKSTLLELECRVSFRSPRALTLASALALYFPGAGAFARLCPQPAVLPPGAHGMPCAPRDGGEPFCSKAAKTFSESL